MPVNYRVADFVKMNLLSSEGVFPLSSISITESVNTGLTWSANSVGYDGIMSLPEATIFHMHIKTMTDQYISPPLVVERLGRKHSISGGKSGTISGFSRATWLMTKDDLTLDTFTNTDSIRVIERCIKDETGVIILGQERFPLPEDDVKGSKILDVLNRYLAYSGQNWYERRDGKIQCFPVTYQGPVNQDFRYSEFSDDISFSQRVDSFKVEKTSRIASGEEVCFQFDSEGFKTVQLPSPLIRATPIDRSSYGYINYVTTFNGDPNSPGSKATGFFDFRNNVIIRPGAIDISPPSTHASLVVRRPEILIGTTLISAKVCFVGAPYVVPNPNEPIPTSPAFRRLIGSVGPNLRPSRDIWTDTLMPSAQWITDHSLAYMQERNKGYHPMSASGPLELSAALLQGFTSPGFPVGTLTSFTHAISASSNSATTSYSGHVPYPTVAPSIGFW